MFVTKAIAHDVVYRLDLSDPDAEPIKVASEIGWSNSMQFHPQNGDLYSPVNLYGEINRWKKDSTTGEREKVFSGLEFPAAIEFDAAGNIYVAEFLTGEVSKLDLETGGKTVMATLAPGLDNVAVSPEGRVFASEFPTDRLVEVYLDGRPPRQVTAPSLGIVPEGMVILGEGDNERLLFKDAFYLKEVDQKTYESRLIATAGFIEPVLGNIASGNYRPEDITVNKAGVATLTFGQTMHKVDDNTVIYAGGAADFSNTALGAIQVYDVEQEKAVRTFLAKRPIDAVMVGENIYYPAVDRTVNRVTPDGKHEVIFESTYPLGLAADESNLLLGDYVEGKIYQLIKDGKELKEPEVLITGLSGPEVIKLSHNGDLLVMEAKADRLTRINLSTGEKTVLATDLGVNESVPEWSEDKNFYGLVSSFVESSDGTIYVAAQAAREVLVLKPKGASTVVEKASQLIEKAKEVIEETPAAETN